MDTQLTGVLQEWLNLPAERRNIETGRWLILKLTRNRILADNFTRFPSRYMSHAEYQLQKFLNVRLAEQDHKDVERMSLEVAQICERDGLDRPLPGNEKKAVQKRIARTEKFVKGRRADHDRLPEDIQALYKENLHIMQQKRAIHAQLMVITAKASKDYCPDGDRYPLVQEIIRLDKQERENWKRYDEYQLP